MSTQSGNHSERIHSNRELGSNIPELDETVGQQAQAYIDTLTKPQGSLGRLEELAIELAKMTADPFPKVTPPGVLIFAADHGIVAEGVSAFPQEVTAQMVLNFLHGGAAISVFSKQIGAILQIVDVGVATDIEAEGLLSKKVGFGTANFLQQDAMTKEQALQSIQAGAEAAAEMIQKGAKLLVIGEMGIGNTTSSSAILAALTGADIGTIVGKGTGIDAAGLSHKQQVIAQALQNRQPNANDPLDVLMKVGGFEIGAMAGVVLEAAAQRIPVLVDGFISTVAALLATRIQPLAGHYLIMSHRSQEQGHQKALEALNKQPLLDLGLRLGEGSGAAVAFPIVEAASRMINEMATFASAGVAEKSSTNEPDSKN